MFFTRTLGWALIVTMALTGLTANACSTVNTVTLSPDPQVQTGQIVAVITEVFATESEAVIETTIRIFMCESGLRIDGQATGIIRHVDEHGELLTGPDGKDLGAGQLRPSSHTAAWTKELDVENIWDHVTYALTLQHEQIARGKNRFTDWYPSRDCWQQAPLTMEFAQLDE